MIAKQELADGAQPSLAVFIPAFEAEHTLRRVVARIPESSRDRLQMILIQDDASTDETAAVAADIAAQVDKVHAFRNERNLGYGGTIKRAHERMVSAGIDAYVMVHSDLQHDPELVDSMLAPICAGTADIVLGSRMMGGALRGGMPISRWAANRFLTWRLNRVLGLNLTDYHTGYVAATSAAMSEVDIGSCGDGHELTAEVLVRAAAASLSILEVHVPTHYDSASRSCSIANSTRYAVEVLRMTSRLSGKPTQGSHPVRRELEGRS